MPHFTSQNPNQEEDDPDYDFIKIIATKYSGDSPWKAGKGIDSTDIDAQIARNEQNAVGKSESSDSGGIMSIFGGMMGS